MIIVEDEITNELYFSIKGIAEYFNITEDTIQNKLNQYKLYSVFSEDIDVFWNRITLRCFKKLAKNLHLEKEKVADAIKTYDNRENEIYTSMAKAEKELLEKKEAMGMEYYLEMQRTGNIW